jgi:outer membrane protein assembly factor BamD (BamD/ComL family)
MSYEFATSDQAMEAFSCTLIDLLNDLKDIYEEINDKYATGMLGLAITTFESLGDKNHPIEFFRTTTKRIAAHNFHIISHPMKDSVLNKREEFFNNNDLPKFEVVDYVGYIKKIWYREDLMGQEDKDNMWDYLDILLSSSEYLEK